MNNGHASASATTSQYQGTGRGAQRGGRGRDVGGQAFALGLVDEVAMYLVPVVFGTGERYFGSVDAQHLLEDPHTVIQGRRVRRLRYSVRRQPVGNGR